MLNIGILLSVIIVGIWLIRSVIKEVEQRETIEKIEKELEKAYEVEKRANEELKNLDKVKNQFLLQTQHDLRTPLTAVRGYCDLLLGGTFGKQSKKTKDVLERIETVITGKMNDINNFLDIAQFKLGKGVVSLKPGVELLPMLDEITNGLAYKAESKGIYLKLEKPDKILIISADREKLKAAIFNIVDNAVKYTTTGGVDIKVETNDVLNITVSDTGIGIPQDKIKNIFESQFERTAMAQKTDTGSGIGLYLSGQIIKLHNGKVWAESGGEGKGSTFHIELPINPTEALILSTELGKKI
jgi:signal transduction histidine kinase